MAYKISLNIKIICHNINNMSSVIYIINLSLHVINLICKQINMQSFNISNIQHVKYLIRQKVSDSWPVFCVRFDCLTVGVLTVRARSYRLHERRVGHRSNPSGTRHSRTRRGCCSRRIRYPTPRCQTACSGRACPELKSQN